MSKKSNFKKQKTLQVSAVIGVCVALILSFIAEGISSSVTLEHPRYFYARLFFGFLFFSLLVLALNIIAIIQTSNKRKPVLIIGTLIVLLCVFHQALAAASINFLG